VILQGFYLLLCYLLGALPTGPILAALTGVTDPRTAGSGNIGATNMARVNGRALGAATLAGDVAKGLLPALGALALYGPITASLAALFAVLGHCFSIYLELRGGKGVATSAGALLALAPWATLLAIGVWALVFAASRRSSLAGLAGAVAIPFLCLALNPPMIPVSMVIGAIVIARHSGNIQRLIAGEEKPIDL